MSRAGNKHSFSGLATGLRPMTGVWSSFVMAPIIPLSPITLFKYSVNITDKGESH